MYAYSIHVCGACACVGACRVVSLRVIENIAGEASEASERVQGFAQATLVENPAAAVAAAATAATASPGHNRLVTRLHYAASRAAGGDPAHLLPNHPRMSLNGLQSPDPKQVSILVNNKK